MSAPSPPAAPPLASPPAPFAASRWVPDRPLFVLASPRLADAQRTARGALDLLGVLGAVTGHDLGDLVALSTALFGVDALHADPLAAIGVDPAGGWAVFSDDGSPTVVVHLAAPAQMAAFLAHQRAQVATHAVKVDGIDVESAVVPAGPPVRWAIDRDWLWVHVALPGAPGPTAAPASAPDDGRWFAGSHARHDAREQAAWTGNWAWAQRAAGAAAGLVGVIDLRGAIGQALGKAPEAVACARLAEPIGKVALALEGDDHHAAVRVALDVGSTDRLHQMVLPAPSGWDATAAQAAIAVQWNLDLAALRSWLAPCLALAGDPLAAAGDIGVRAARGLVTRFDIDAQTGAGAIALDVSSTAFFERQLDRIPLRSLVERSRTFGPYRGHAIAIPSKPPVEYVIDRGLVLGAVGDGLLARLVAPAPAASSGSGAAPGTSPVVAPVMAIDVAPPAMPVSSWEGVLHVLVEHRLDGSPSPAVRRAASLLMSWRDARLAVTAEGSAIVLRLSGNRR